MHRIAAFLPWLAGFAVPLVLAAAGSWAHSDLRPPGEEPRVEIGYGWMFWVVAAGGCMQFVALRLLVPAERRGWRVGGTIASFVLAGLFGLLYVYSWSVYTLWISPEGSGPTARSLEEPAGFRIFRSHRYTQPVYDEWETNKQLRQPETSLNKLLEDAVFATEDIFAEGSRDTLPLLVLGSWAAMCFSLVAASQFLTRIAEHALQKEEAAIADLRTRLATVREKLPPAFADQLENAIDTLAKAENVKGTVVSVAGLFAGRFGLLTQLVAENQAAAEARMAAWNDKESKDLRRKYQASGFAHLDFLEQIEIVRRAELVTPTIGSDLHWIRMRGNEARHANAPTMPRTDALKALSFAVEIGAWYAGQSSTVQSDAHTRPNSH